GAGARCGVWGRGAESPPAPRGGGAGALWRGGGGSQMPRCRESPRLASAPWVAGQASGRQPSQDKVVLVPLELDHETPRNGWLLTCPLRNRYQRRRSRNATRPRRPPPPPAGAPPPPPRGGGARGSARRTKHIAGE